MENNNKNSKTNDNKGYVVNREANRADMEDYGYDFVAELAHFTNIDEQEIMAKRLEDISEK